VPRVLVFKTVDLSSDLLTMTAAYTHVGTA